jgi:hypothetical protein
MSIFPGFFMVAALGLTTATALAAGPAPLKNDPRRPVDLISRDLGVTEQEFVACFNNVNPTGQGTRPTSDRVHANKAVLLPCLQKANPAITNDQLDQVMDRYRPGGHEAQRPMGQ